MKKLLVFFILPIFIFSCSDVDDKIDPELVKKDRETLNKSIGGYDVTVYKFIKICIRASVEKQYKTAEFVAFKSKFDRVSKIINKTEGNPNDLSITDYLAIYSDFLEMTDFVNRTDEDLFPTFFDAANVISEDLSRQQIPYLQGDEKILQQNYEHAFLSALMMVNGSFGENILLYECSKTHPELISDSEPKTLFLFLRGLFYFKGGLYYLSESEISQNIEWLNNNSDIQLPIIQFLFQWGNFSQTESHTAYHSLNHLFRGFNRLMMKREIDEVRALEDFNVFLDDSKKLGLDNELIWATDAFVAIKIEDSNRAIDALEKLRKSDLLRDDDKEIIEEAIEYLRDRENDKVMNGLYDKYFLSKIAVKFMYNKFAKTDWKKLLKENNVPFVKEIFKDIESFTQFSDNFNKYTSDEAIEEMENELLEEGDKLLEEGKELLNSTSEELEDKAGDLWDNAKGLF